MPLKRWQCRKLPFEIRGLRSAYFNNTKASKLEFCFVACVALLLTWSTHCRSIEMSAVVLVASCPCFEGEAVDVAAIIGQLLFSLLPFVFSI